MLSNNKENILRLEEMFCRLIDKVNELKSVYSLGILLVNGYKTNEILFLMSEYVLCPKTVLCHSIDCVNYLLFPIHCKGYGIALQVFVGIYTLEASRGISFLLKNNNRSRV